jgi:uncharacterized protein
MNLFDKVNEDMKTAMLAKEKDKLEALKSIKAAFLLAKTEKGAPQELTPEKEIMIVQKLLKQRKESADIYKANNRQDLYSVEMFQASVIEKYLPAQMSEEELMPILKEIIEQTGATSIKDMGKVMGAATKQLAGKADSKTISDKIRFLLGA